MRYYVNNSIYKLNNSVIVNNKKYQIEVTKDLKQIEPDYKFIENDIVKEGNVSLRILDNVFKPIPNDYLHVLPDSLGFDIGAGLFKK